MSQIKVTRFTGDQFYITVELESVDNNNVKTPVDVSSATTIKAGLINEATVVAADNDLDSGIGDADWANGVVVAVFASNDTKTLDPDKDYFLQIRVENGISPSPQTFQTEFIEITRGYLS